MSTEEEQRSSVTPSTIETGRVRACGGLLVSVNRCWQVETEPGSRPVAAFKSVAPIALPPGADGKRGTGDTYLAAVTGHDAFWLGFEAEEGEAFAVVPYLDGCCLLTGRESPCAELVAEPRNFLVVPDQPWLDSVAGEDGSFRQIVPAFAAAAAREGRIAGDTIRLVFYRLDPEASGSGPDLEPKEPVPLYTQQGAAKLEGDSVHSWPGRALRGESLPTRPCAEFTFVIVPPVDFVERTGTELPSEFFEEESASPLAPHSPFGPP